ncbi:MAG: GerMN domain-containing protein [Selenomonadaceae bacterium]|nr:GerMN domain-containing protein [Selenomonadaceae bacterium]
MKKILVPAMLALLLFTAGCDKPPAEEPPPKPPETPAQTKPDVKPETKPEQKPAPDTPTKKPENQPVKNEKTEQSMNVKVYYPDDSGMKLVEVEREIIVDDSVDKYTAAVETLMEEPTEENLTRIFPKNAAIRSVTVRDGLATVDFDGSILKGFVGGSTGEEFLIGSIVDTLTNFPEVKRVKFLVDGNEIETLSGHMDLSTPLERMNTLTQ